MATSACRAIGAPSWPGIPATAAGEQHDVVAFKAGEIGSEELASGYDDDIEPGIGLVASEQLAGEAFGSVADNGPPEFAGRRHAQTGLTVGGRVAGEHEHGHEAAVPLRPMRVDVLEIDPTANALVRLQSLGHARSWRGRPLACRAYDTVRRFRPLARRRFRTRRPFLVLMRSRKPCVFRRRLRLG